MKSLEGHRKSLCQKNKKKPREMIRCNFTSLNHRDCCAWALPLWKAVLGGNRAALSPRRNSAVRVENVAKWDSLLKVPSVLIKTLGADRLLSVVKIIHLIYEISTTGNRKKNKPTTKQTNPVFISGCWLVMNNGILIETCSTLLHGQTEITSFIYPPSHRNHPP